MNADIAMIGLGVMGGALARNFARNGFTVAVHDRDADTVDRFVAEHGAEATSTGGGFVGVHALADVPGALVRPARIVLLVPAGAPVDSVVDALAPHLEPEDIVVDGGNSHFADTERRAQATAGSFRFVGMGVSGGQKGALLGPAMMPGGDAEAYAALQPILEAACARSDSGPCVAHCGRTSAGHFVKMVHNGIEYGDMQLIAEVHSLLREGLEKTPAQTRDVFVAWNEGALKSYLIEITAGIVAARDPQGDGPLVDQILDVAGQKGTGRWTSIMAVEAGVPLPTVTAAVDGRALSAMKAARVEAGRLFYGAIRPGEARLHGVTVADLEAALYAAKLCSYSQGFSLLRAASEARDYGTDLAAVSRIWKAGCIIRAAFLDDVHAAFERRPDLPLLILDPDFAEALRARLPAWRRVVAAAVTAGLPVPALSASLAWFDGLARARGTANIIQAQRDWFGAHTYRRVDAPDVAVHSDWESLAQVDA
jgi:6-phosphogluconate dehydrogenase